MEPKAGAAKWWKGIVRSSDKKVHELGELIEDIIHPWLPHTGPVSQKNFLKRWKRHGPFLERVAEIIENLPIISGKSALELMREGRFETSYLADNDTMAIYLAVCYEDFIYTESFINKVRDIETKVYKRLESSGEVLEVLRSKLMNVSSAACSVAVTPKGAKVIGKLISNFGRIVPFSIVSEIVQSMTEPFATACCGVVTLRPNLAYVCQIAGLSLSESLQDKLGPFCTSVFDANRCEEPYYLSFRNIPRSDPFMVDVTKLTVGYYEDSDINVVEKLRSEGVNMVPFKFYDTDDSAQCIVNFPIDVLMLAHLNHSGQDVDYEAQDQWPLVVPAVDYVQAQRARGKQIRNNFKVDAFVGNATEWELVCVGNLVDMPVIVVPIGLKKISGALSDSRNLTICVYAPQEHGHIAYALAMSYQSVMGHHKQCMPIDDLRPEHSIPNQPKRIMPPRQLRGLLK